MDTVRCPNCEVENDPIRTAGYCEGCGKKLPAASSYRVGTPGPARAPVRPGPDDFRDPYDAIRKSTSPEFENAKRQAAGALFVVAVLNLVCNGLGLFFLEGADPNGPMQPEAIAVAVGILVAISVVFAGLGFWALYQPLPAAIVGLVAFVLYSLADIAMEPEHFYRGLIFKILIVVALIRAISSAVKARNVEGT